MAALRALLAIVTLSGVSASALEYDLSAGDNDDSFRIMGSFGGEAVFADHFTQPTGTGVFQPFLTIDANGQTATGSKKVEHGYNTDGKSALYLDQHRPEWNKQLTFGDLARVEFEKSFYYAFLLDANEPGGDKSLISVDNIRIYTSASDNTGAVGNDISNLDALGTLRWAMNDVTVNHQGKFEVDNWVKLDAAQESVEAGEHPSNGGSGMSDMVLYVPEAAFAGALKSDFVWFYNLNGIHHVLDKDIGSEAGFEEWRAVVGPQHQLPEGGTSVALLGFSLAGLQVYQRVKRAKR